MVLEIASVSKLKKWKSCRQAFYYRYVQGLTKKRAMLPLFKGKLIHQLLEALYKGESWEDELKKIKIQFDELMEEEKEYYGLDLISDLRNIMKILMF